MNSTENSEKYTWGDGCFGWHLLKQKELGVIQEMMPPGTSEKKHRHHISQQFFYILKGEAVITVDGTVEKIKAFEGLSIPPGTIHCIENKGDNDLEFIVISAPHSHGDREDL